MMRRNKPRSKSIISSPITLVVAAVVLFVTSRAAIHIHEKAVASEEKLAEEQASLNKLQANHAKMTAALNDISTDEGIAAQIREKYHAVEPGENVAVVVNTTQTKSASDLSTGNDESANLNWWQRFLGIFGL